MESIHRKTHLFGVNSMKISLHIERTQRSIYAYIILMNMSLVEFESNRQGLQLRKAYENT